MRIQWFPGHMTKALRMMQEQLQQVDCIIYVLDSRAPFSCLNPKFDALTDKKPVLYVLNKCDLVERADLEKWLGYFAENGKKCIAADSLNGKQRDNIVNILKQLNAAVIEKYRLKGAKKSVRAMVVGVPNSGKSTVINAMCKRAGAVTGNRPGVTRGKQWMSIGGVDFLDTPGTLWGKFEEESVARHLAYIGSIRDEVLDLGELVYSFIDEIKGEYGTQLASRYGLAEVPDDPLAVFDAIALARGFKTKGGEPDYDRTARCILDDFRKGRLGKIMLEKPKMQGLMPKKRG